MIGEQDLAVYLSKFDKKYWLTYKVLDILQKVSNQKYCILSSVRAARNVVIVACLADRSLQLKLAWPCPACEFRRVGVPNVLNCKQAHWDALPFLQSYSVSLANMDTSLCRYSTGRTLPGRLLWRCARATMCNA